MLDDLEPIMSAGGNVVEFHSVDFFPERWFDLVLVLRTDNTVLYDRLIARYVHTLNATFMIDVVLHRPRLSPGVCHRHAGRRLSRFSRARAGELPGHDSSCHGGPAL